MKQQRGETMNLKLRVDKLEELQTENSWTDTELAKRMGISRSRLWRAKLPAEHNEYCSPGESLIIGVLKAFPEKKFDDLFFLDKTCS
jgi:DNA-binding XRE family transcriptional regulator